MSDYKALLEKYYGLILEIEKIRKENKTLKLQNEIINDMSSENEKLKQEIYELKLLLHKKVNKYVEAMRIGK